MVRSSRFLILALVFLAGCHPEYNLATQKEEMIYYSTEREVNIGRNIDKALAKDKEFKLAEDPLVAFRVENIGRRIVAVCDRQEIPYYFRTVEDKEVNAYSLPGGYVYVNTGLVEKCANDDELAGVIAHEVAHIVARHSVKRLQAVMGYQLLRMATMAAPQSQPIGATADYAFAQILMGYSRDDELLADKLAARYCKEAGYDPYAMVAFLQKLGEIGRKKPRPYTYFRTHPFTSDRIRTVKQELGEEMTFDDFINIEQEYDRPLQDPSPKR